MRHETTVLIVMENVHQALKMEERCDLADINCRTVAKPRTLGADCGIALKINAKLIPLIKKFANEENCTIFGVFYQEHQHWLPYPDNPSE
ncbi:DUF3343 domain-containing protein [bacterium]|nr:DUF3343 domain-containing protein [candidate division CSSED10-310 bacterium]